MPIFDANCPGESNGSRSLIYRALELPKIELKSHLFNPRLAEPLYFQLDGGAIDSSP